LPNRAVHHCREVGPALPGADVLDVGDPDPVRGGRDEVTLDQIVADAHAQDSDRGEPVAISVLIGYGTITVKPIWVVSAGELSNVFTSSWLASQCGPEVGYRTPATPNTVE
jgi:hypothetical protein